MYLSCESAFIDDSFLNFEMLQGGRCSDTLLEPEASSWELGARELVSLLAGYHS